MKNINEIIPGLKKAFPEIKLLYFFGSKANGDDGPMSDWDFAVYFDKKTKEQHFDLQQKLISYLTKELKTNEVDLTVLNSARSPELKYHIVIDGKLLIEDEPTKITIEPRIWNEYFDFVQTLKKFNLTKA